MVPGLKVTEVPVELNMTIYVASGKGYLPVAKYKENEFLKLMNEQSCQLSITLK